MFNYMCIYTSLHQEHVITPSIFIFYLSTKFLAHMAKECLKIKLIPLNLYSSFSLPLSKSQAYEQDSYMRSHPQTISYKRES